MLQELLTLDIPRGGKPLDLLLLAVSPDLLILLATEFQPSFLVALRLAPWTLACRIKKFLGVNQVNRSLLEFDGVGTRISSYIDELLGDFPVPILADADFSDYKQAHEFPPASYLIYGAAVRLLRSRTPRHPVGAAQPRPPP